MNTIKTKRLAALLLAAVMVLSMIPAVFAEEESEVLESCAVIGANLSEEQIASVYKLFGIERGSVTELKVTNAEEREYLKGKVDDSTIGTRSISCVYIEILPEDSGLTITCENISWCTENVYRNALTTAGIYDANVIIAAPFSVSGTAALTGIYKAYETVTGEELDADAKSVAVDELVITSDLADQIGDIDASEIVNELKLILDETEDMTDAELESEIRSIAKEYNVTLTDDEISKLISLCRQLEKLNVSELTEKVQSIQNTIKTLEETAEKVSAAKDKAEGFIAKVSSFFASVGNFFKNLFGK